MKYTVTRALAELKTLQSRIYTKVQSLKPFDVSVGKNLKLSYYKTKENFEKDTKEDIQSINDLISRQVLLKMAIDKSNYETTVKVGDKEMTILEVLIAKKYLESKRYFLSKLEKEFINVTGTLERVQAENAKKVENLVNQALGNSAGKSKDDKEDLIKKFTEMVEGNEPISLLDPENCQEKIKKMKEEIEMFSHEVDYILSESNSTTFIEIPD